MKLNVNYSIALTHILSRKKQTITAALGVTIGMAIYLFMNSLSAGFTKYSRNEIFKSNAHIKIYKDDIMSKPLVAHKNTLTVIINPQITNVSKKIINPEALLNNVKKQPYITNAIAQVNFDAFYSRGSTQIKGTGNGVSIMDYSAMFNFNEYMVAGSLMALQDNKNGIIIGSSISDKLSLTVDDNITVSSSYGVVKVLKIVGIFSTGSDFNDSSKCYTNIVTAQQFLKEGPDFVSAIYANTPDPDESEAYVGMLKQLTEYTVEDWKTTNADVLAGDSVRGLMMGAISLSILLVAGFGIYNILNMTVSQKINDIAILKAIGFSGKDVIRIFVSEAFIMGLLGTFAGVCIGLIMVKLMSGIYVGPPIGYFPIYFELVIFMKSFLLGLGITICAGYFPARKASKVDPVSIFRR
ncbi:FtsX-like permease family protein [Flavobacterium sp.]|uniref:ABC transporter permease n=1 Tax=Flavobacterium sp. TaxID=239 RepID=UPI00261EC16A|nr:FtsX-like permease family protein [Flavobacterium sp.]